MFCCDGDDDDMCTYTAVQHERLKTQAMCVCVCSYVCNWRLQFTQLYKL